MKNVLYVTSKWINPLDSNDGGDTTFLEIVNAIGINCQLDILCFRKKEKNIINYKNIIHEIYFYNQDFSNYDFYKNLNGEKFKVRLIQSQIVAKEIKKIEYKYDIIIIQHCQFILGMLKFPENILKKIILLPMFTGTAYKKSREFVPQEYITAEKNMLSKIKKIISPSTVEKETLVKDYNVDASRIIVIPRSISNITFSRIKKQHKLLRIIYVASIRKQKAHFDAIKLIYTLIKKGIKSELHCVGAIQDEIIYKSCMEMCNKYNIKDKVIFHGVEKHDKVLNLLKNSDINISVSYWETFGRGIFEGMAIGTPTIVLNRLSCIRDFPLYMRPIIAYNIEDMAKKIIDLYSNDISYQNEQKKGKYIQKFLSYAKISKLLNELILKD